MKQEELIAFVRLTYTMRKAQKAYFREKKIEDLKQSKALEKRVDETIVSLMNEHYNEKSKIPFPNNN